MKRWKKKWFFTLIAGFAIGCAGLYPFPWPLVPEPFPSNSLVMLGGNAQHAFAGDTDLAPPLELWWKKRLESIIADHPLIHPPYLIAPLLSGTVQIFHLTTHREIGAGRLGVAMAHAPLIWNQFLVLGFNHGNNTLLSFNLKEASTVYQKKYSHITTAITYGDQKIYFGTRTGLIICANSFSGDSIWVFRFSESVLSSPVVEDGIVVAVSQHGKLVALDATSGIVLWQHQLKEPVWADLSAGDSLVFIPGKHGGFYAFRLQDGSLSWSRQFNGAFFGGCAVKGGLVYVGNNAHRVLAMKQSDGAVIWRFATNGVVNKAPFATPEYLYVGSWDGRLYVLNRFNGEQLWQYDFKSPVRTTPVVVGDYLFVQTANRQLWIFQSHRERAGRYLSHE